MAWVIQRGGSYLTRRGWRPATDGPAAKYATQGEAQEVLDELRKTGLAALGGAVDVKEV